MNGNEKSEGNPQPEAISGPLARRLARERERLGQQSTSMRSPASGAGHTPLAPARLPPVPSSPTERRAPASLANREEARTQDRTQAAPAICVYKRRRRAKGTPASSEHAQRERQRVQPETRAEMLERLTNPLISLHEASILLRVCPATVRRYSDSGLLAAERTDGGQRRFHLKDVLALMRQLEAKGK